MSRILLVCPTFRDVRELHRLGLDRSHTFIPHGYASDELEQMTAECGAYTGTLPDISAVRDRLVDVAKTEHVDAVISTDDYPGVALASFVAAELGLAGTPPCASLLCQHKLYARRLQQHLVPDATPWFTPIEEGQTAITAASFPVFVKPVKSFFSVGSYRVEDARSAQSVLRRATLPRPFFAPFASLFEQYTGSRFGSARVLAEELLSGTQATFEGYALDGRVMPIGIVDSVMYPRTIAFERFEYPSRLPETIQKRVGDIAARALKALGFDHGLFNLEFMYDERTDRLAIIEINPRMASQFADLYEKVDGTNTYELLVALALRKQVPVKHRAGRYGAAVSRVFRVFRDAVVRRTPSTTEVAAIARDYSDARIEVLAETGRRLSEQMQDGRSYRYAIINAGGSDHKDAERRACECRRRLTFQCEDEQNFVGPGSTGNTWTAIDSLTSWL